MTPAERVEPGGRPVRLSGVRQLWSSGGDEYDAVLGRLGRLAGRKQALAIRARDKLNDSAPIQLWDAATGHLLRTFANSRAPYDGDIVWGYRADGSALLAVASYDSTGIWDAETGECRRTIPEAEPYRRGPSLAWRDQGRLLLAIGSHRRQVEIFDPDEGAAVRTLTPGGNAAKLAWATDAHGHELLAVTVYPEGDSVPYDFWVEIWDPATGEHVETLPGNSVTLPADWLRTPDGLVLATGLAEGVRIRGYSGGRADGTERLGASGRQSRLRWAPLTDGRKLIATMGSAGLSMWDAGSCERLNFEQFGFDKHSHSDIDWALAPDGKLLFASVSSTGKVRVWEVVLDPPAGQTARHA